MERKNGGKYTTLGHFFADKKNRKGRGGKYLEEKKKIIFRKIKMEK